MTKLFKNKIAIVLCCVLLLACCLVCAQFVAPTALADTPSGTTTPSVTPPTYNPTVSFSALDGVNDSGSTEVYGNLFDGSIGTKYCVKIGANPYVVFKSSSHGTKISGYKFYTANDTASHEGRNPKSWVLYGSNNYDESAKTGTWTAIHTVTDDTTMGATNRTGYLFTVSNAGVYKYFKFEFTARRGAASDDQGTWTDSSIQLSEIEMQATVETTQTMLFSSCDWSGVTTLHTTWHDDDVTTYDGTNVSINAHISNNTNSQKALIYGVAVYAEQALSDSQINRLANAFHMIGTYVVDGDNVSLHEGNVNVIVSADKKCVALQTDNKQLLYSCNVYFDTGSSVATTLYAHEYNLTELAFLYRYQCEHKFTGSYTERVESTCTVQGARKYRTCANGCGACQYYDDAGDLQTCEVNEFHTKVMLPLAQHTWSTTEVIAEQPATCAATGMLAHYECSVCHKLFDSNKVEKTSAELTIEALEHDYGTVSYVWNEDYSCTASRVCSRDVTHIDSETSKLGGNFVSQHKSCTLVELTTYQVNFTNSAFSRQTKVVQTDGTSPHSWSTTAIIAEIPATCTATGTKAHWYCTSCKKNYGTDKSTELTDLTIEKVAHTYDDWMPYNAPSCTAGGIYANRQCSVCSGYQYISDTTITDYDAYVAADSHPALQTCTRGQSERVKLAPSSHTYGTWTARKAVSCEEDGNHAYRQCSVCNKYQYITDPLVVDYDSHVNGAGTDVYTCIQSEFNSKIKFAATGHSYTESTWIPAQAPTCTTAGNYAYHQCDNCTGFQYIDDLSVTTVALCEQYVANTANSAHVLFVEEASFESTVKLAALEHSYGAWVPAVAKGCLTDGNLEYRQCSNCNSYQYVPTGSTQAQAEECDSTEFNSHIKLESYGGHDTLVTYKEVVNGVHYHGNKCQREGCGAWDGARVACSYDDWTTSETKHWHECSVCEQHLDEAEHTSILVYNYSKHWNECSVCEKELTQKTAHTFASETATSCNTEGCGYKRLLDLTFTLQNYQIDGLVKDVKLALSTSNTEVTFTSTHFAIYMLDGRDPIGELRDPTATVLRHQMYLVYFSFNFGQFYPAMQSMDSIVLPEGASIKSLSIQLFGDDFTINGAFFLPALAGETTATTVPEVEITFDGLQVGSVWSNSMVSVTSGLTLADISAYQGGDELSATTTITDEYELSFTLDIVAPKGQNFFGYTKDDVAIANDIGEVMEIWISPGGSRLTVDLEVRSLVKEHTCAFDYVMDASYDDSNNPDPSRYHCVYCAVCFKKDYVEHVFDGALDEECDACGFDERVISPERIDITLTGYAIDAKVREVTLSVGENDYGIDVKGNNYNNGYVIMYSDQYATQKKIVAETARFYPGIKYYLVLTLTFDEPTDMLDAAQRLYVNGVNVVPVYMTQSYYDHTSGVLLELTPLVGITTQQKVTNFTIECLDVPTNGQTFHVAATETAEYLSFSANSGVLYAEGRVYDAEDFHQEGFVLTYGFKYYVNVILVLADGYHYNGMDISDVTLTADFQHGGSFQTVEVVRAGYEIFDTDQVCFVEYKFLIQMDHEVTDHVCFEQTIGFEGTQNGHYAVCKCGAMSTTLEQHVYETADSEQCKLCGYCRKLPITELVFTVDYYIGQNPDIYDSGVELWASIDQKFGDVVYCNMYEQFNWQEQISVAADMILPGKPYFAGIAILLDTKYDLSTLTTQTAVIRGIGDEDIHATLVVGDYINAGKWEVNIVFELPALDLPHVHGGALLTGTPATCEESGLKDSFTCTICDKMFDAATKAVITDRTIEPLGHDWTLMFCEEAAQKGEGNFHDYYCLTCHAWKGEREECDIDTDWQRDNNNHWRICEDCGHRHFLGEHTQAMVCDAKHHWTACPVCDKDFGTHVAHVFENEQSTTCSTEGCSYQRYSEMEIEVENYVVDGLMTSLDATATNKTHNKEMSLVRAYFFDENIKLIEIWRDEGGLEFGTTFQPETIYFVEFVFRCDNYFFDTRVDAEGIKLPAGYSFVEFGYDTWRDSPDEPRYNVFYLIAFMPQIGGVSQLEKVPNLQLEVSNFAAEQFVGDVEIAANANAEVVKHEVLRGGLVIPFDMKLNNNGFYTLNVTLSAPVGYTFRGYTASDVTVKNNFGEVVGVDVSDSGSLLVVTIETRPTVGDHKCSEHLVCISPDRDSIVSPDAENKHRRYCEICGEYTYEAHVYDDKLDQTCNLCGYKRYYKLERMDIIVENYVLDGNVDQIKIKIAQNDYSVQVVGTFNNNYHVLDSNGNFYFGDYSRFLPNEQYTIRFDVTANSIVSFENVKDGNVYINGQPAEIYFAAISSNTTKISYDLYLPKLTGTTTQQMATGIDFTATGVTLGGNMCDFILNSSVSNAAVVALAKDFYRVNGNDVTPVAADVGKFEAGYQYYIKLRIKLADGYYAKGMGEGDVTLGNFPLVGEVTYSDDVLGAGISPGAATIVIYTFKILFPQGEEHVHAFTGENLHYDITTAGHAVICDCGALSTRVAHVPSETDESVCSVCGGTIMEVLSKLEFSCTNYQVGAFVELPALSSTNKSLTIGMAMYCDEYDFENFACDATSMIVMAGTRYALVFMCTVQGDISGLTLKDIVLKGVGETDIAACYMDSQISGTTSAMLIGFELPEPPRGNSHIHGGLWVDEVPASCTENGTKGYYECTICHEKFDDENNAIEDLVILALGHKWSTTEIVAEVAAKCAETGVKAYWHCENCNTDFAADKTTVLTDLAIAALGHKWSTTEIIAEVPAKCAETGIKAHWHCETCNTNFAADKTTALTDLTIAALGHKWSTAEIIAEVPANCTQAGTKAHWHCEACNSNFAADKITALTDLTIAALGHKWSTAEIIAEVAAKCGIAGTKAYWHCETCNTDFAADKTTVLTDLVIEVLVHNFGEWIVEVPATAEKTGTVAHKDCTLCGRHFDSDGVEIADISIPKLAGYLITFKIDGEVVGEQRIATGEKVTYPAGGEKLGFTFSWSKTIQTMPAEDVVVEGVFAVDVNYFKGKVDAVANANSVEAKFQAIVAANKALALYNDTEKQVLASEVSRLNTLVSEYKQAISSANADLNNAAGVVDVLLGAFVQVALAAVAAVVIKRRLF